MSGSEWEEGAVSTKMSLSVWLFCRSSWPCVAITCPRPHQLAPLLHLPTHQLTEVQLVLCQHLVVVLRLLVLCLQRRMLAINRLSSKKKPPSGSCGKKWFGNGHKLRHTHAHMHACTHMHAHRHMHTETCTGEEGNVVSRCIHL